MIRADSIDFLNLLVERHRLVNQELDELVGGGFSRQQLEFFVDPVDPSSGDTGGNLGGGGESQGNTRSTKT